MTLSLFVSKSAPRCVAARDAWSMMAGKYGHKLNVIDVDKYPEEAGMNGIRAVPCLIVETRKPYKMKAAVSLDQVETICQNLGV